MIIPPADIFLCVLPIEINQLTAQEVLTPLIVKVLQSNNIDVLSTFDALGNHEHFKD